ncbi:MAG: hypothetical protein A2076_02605 [Geobacteraceae bacterium GWC2_53_11]|nr:MAG: hypothetical protein A2076_02605 [Geobacteraceae bacterium GWC2_53_11]
MFNRKPQDANFSVERLFKDIVKAFPPNLIYNSYTSKFKSRGFWSRLYNTVEAFCKQGDVNHITGDVHYLCYLMSKNKTLLTILDCGNLKRLNGIRRTIFYFLWFWLPVKKVAMITVISESTKKELLQYVRCDERKIRVIPCCISDDFKPSPKAFNSSNPVLLQIGTAYNKNLPKVAEAISGIPCHLRIIGKLSEEQISQLLAFDISYSSVSNLTDLEIIDEYIKCDALIFASTYEGFGMPIVEANITGRPVVTSNILSMPEVAGNAACLVDPYDAEDIRKGVLKIFSDEDYRKTLVANGYQNARRFKPAIVAEQYVELYKEVYLLSMHSK